MTVLRHFLKPVVAAFLAAMVFFHPALAQTAEDEAVAELLDRLQSVEPRDAGPIEEQIIAAWSKSGSPAMDLLLDRGREAFEAGDFATAIDHFSALIDHAPGFAEAYNARAMTYFRLGRYGLAIEDIRAVLARNPQHFAAIGGLALILQDMGFEQQALETWRAATAINPHMDGAKEAINRLQRSVEGAPL